MLRALLQSKLSKLIESMLAVPVYLRKGLQALLQNMPDMPLRRQPLMFAMLQCIVLDGAAEHATLWSATEHSQA